MRVKIEFTRIKNHGNGVDGDAELTAEQVGSNVVSLTARTSFTSDNPNAGVLDLKRLAAKRFISLLEGTLEAVRADFPELK
jgi:hypothetical protein